MYSNPHAIYFFTMSGSELFLVEGTDEVEENVSESSKVEKVLKLMKFPSPDESCDDETREERYGDWLITMESKQKQLGSSSFEYQVKVEDDDSGFRTPTSLEHRINTQTMQCPPAPRKPKPSLKRKSAQCSFIYRNPPLDLSKEVDSLFPTLPHSSDDHQSTQHNSKKGRKEDAE